MADITCSYKITAFNMLSVSEKLLIQKTHDKDLTVKILPALGV